MKYKFKGRTKEGVLSKGVIEAKSKQEAFDMVKERVETIFVFEIDRKTSGIVEKKVSDYFTKLSKSVVTYFEKIQKTRVQKKTEELTEKSDQEIVELLKLELVNSGVPDHLAGEMTKKINFGSVSIDQIGSELGLTQDQIRNIKINSSPNEKKNKKKKSFILFGREIPNVDLSEKVGEYWETKVNKKIPLKKIINFTNQLTILNRTGVPILEALQTIKDNESNRQLRDVIDDIVIKVTNGLQLSEAMEKHPNHFSRLYVSMVSVGETTGKMAETLKDLNKFLKMQSFVKKEVMKATIYPIMLLSMLILLLIGARQFLIPRFKDIFEGLGIELPLMTRMIFFISDQIFLFLLVIGVFFSGLYILINRSTTFKKIIKLFVDRLAYKLPVIKKTATDVCMFQLSLTISITHKNNISFTDSLELSESTVGNSLSKADIGLSRLQIEEGRGIADAFKDKDYVSPYFKSALAAGEKSGEIDTSLNNLAQYYEEELEESLSKLVQFIQPASIIVMAILTIPFIFGMYLPLQSMIQGI